MLKAGMYVADRYEIVGKIGTGGMSNVYKAKDQILGRFVAIKVLKQEFSEDVNFLTKFRTEAQSAAGLEHPNIVNIYDVGNEDGLHFIVMEYVEGVTLKTYIEKKGQLSYKEAVSIAIQVGRGIEAAHNKHIIHRDIKPQNVMVLRDGSVKVADFGIACLENSAQTLTQEALGSVHYISPEQARGERTDARSDIYSSGVVLYEMLTGRLPFEGDSAVSVAIQHLSAVPLPPRELNPEIPAQLELICMKAMTPDLSRRYASADAMIVDLEDFRKNPNINLDFTMVDLRPEEPAEPTQPIRTYDQTLHPTPKGRERERPRERRRDYEDDYEPLRQGGGGAGVKVLIGVAIVLALALAAVLFKMVTESFEQQQEVPQTYVVPSVLGYTPEQAANLDSVRDIFTLKVNEKSEFSEDYPIGTIARQSPAEGEHRKGGNLLIEVWLSAGEDTGEMLDVTNKTVAQANVLLKSLKEKYNLEIIADEAAMEFSDEVNEGYIIRSEPAEHEELKDGDIIRLIISKGPEQKPVVVSNFVGMQIDAVLRSLLDSLHLTCTPADIEYVESEAEPNSVIWQSLEPLTTVSEWDTIQFKVSKGITVHEVGITITLPQDDRTTVLVEVYVGDEENPQFAERVSTADGTVYTNPPLKGSGIQTVKVYFDGILDQSQIQEVQFS